MMKEKLLKIAKFTLKQCKPENLFKNAIDKKFLNGFERIAVIPIGKASRGMARAIIKILPRKPNAVLFADSGHPLPTLKGVKNTEKIIAVARGLGEKDLAIVLISGGGSAMLCAPVPEIKLEDKIKVTRALLKSGATIQEMNVVRKHLSRVKGGNLAALLYPATVLGFVISDVVGNDLGTIASGPISPDSSTFPDAIRILKKYNIKAQKKVWEYLSKGRRFSYNSSPIESPEGGSCGFPPGGDQKEGGESEHSEASYWGNLRFPQNEKYFKKVKIKILADHFTVLKTAEKYAKKLGLKTKIIQQLITGSARHAAKIFVKMAQPKTLIIAGGETTVTCCKSPGWGGRNQEFVLSGLRYLKPNQTLLSIGTDGIDGICPEPVAGAIADSEMTKNTEKLNLKIDDFLKNNNSYTFFKRTKGLIKTGATGTNLGDLMMLFS